MTSQPFVFLFDVDNTLLDNDAILEDLRRHLRLEFDQERQSRYWKIFDARREKCGYADYLGALQEFRDSDPCDPHFMKIAKYLLDYPFADRLFPGALEVLHKFRQQGLTVIVSDGDVIFQPRKIDRSGLLQAVEGRVLVYIQKCCQLDDVQKHYPADRYVLVDDRLHNLAAARQEWGDCLTTVFARQGHHAHEHASDTAQADYTIDHIGALFNLEF